MEIFDKFLIETEKTIPIFGFVINFILTFLMSLLLSYLYQTFGRSLSNRESFSRNFIIISITTMLIITIVKSSLALSLGLVGALSIIRFRTAIKEPEELSFLFIAIAIGLGFGANQIYVTLVGFILIVITIIIISKSSVKGTKKDSMYLDIKTDNYKINVNSLKKIIIENCSEVILKRYDRSNKNIEFLFIIKFNNNNDLDTLDNSIKELDSTAKVSFLENNNNSL